MKLADGMEQHTDKLHKSILHTLACRRRLAPKNYQFKMGANRKRLANQMSGDGGTPTDKKSKKKKDKKRGSKNKDVGKLGKGSKSNKESSSSAGNSLET